jgi:CheY-like chemotaxis protein
MNDKKRILVAEDEVIIAECLIQDLRDVGYEADYVTSGEKVVSFVEKAEYDIILMDIHLSGRLNGIKAAKQIAVKHDVPFLFITGYDEEYLYEEAKEVKPIAYVHKPIEVEEIIKLLDSHFSK